MKFKYIVFCLFFLSSYFLNITCHDAVMHCVIDTRPLTHNTYDQKTYHASHHHSQQLQRQVHNDEPNLQNYSVAQLKTYFAYNRYKEKQILAHKALFMSDAFVKLAKTLPSYGSVLIALRKEIYKKNFFGKIAGWAAGTHYWGFTDRVEKLYREWQAEQQAEQAAKERQLAEQQRQAQINETYKQKLACAKDCVHTAARARALNITNINPSDKITRSFSVNADTLACANEYGIRHKDLSSGIMNAYEYQLHTEFIEQLSELTRFNVPTKENFFSDLIGQSIALGIEANKNHEPIIATRLADFCWGALEVVQGIGEGVVLGAHNTVDFFAHVIKNPKQAAVDCVRGIDSILCYLGKAIQVPLKLETYYELGEYEQAEEYKKEIHNAVIAFSQACKDKLRTLSKRELAKYGTAFATECVLTEKVLTLGYSVCKRAGPLVVEAFEILKKEPVVEYAVAGAEGMVHKMSNATKNVGSAAKEVIKDSRLALEMLCADLFANLRPEIEQLRKIFDCTRKGFAEFSNKWVKIDYEHILGMELKFNKRGKLSIGGLHHDIMNAIEKSNALEFSNKVMHNFGFYEARVSYIGNKVKDITFFPAHWSRKQVVEKIHEAYEYFLKSGIKPVLESNGKYKVRGIIKEGIEIEMCITKKGKIITAYPLLK